MKENVLDVLIYLFDHCVDSEDVEPADQESLAQELEEAGFRIEEINKAFDWLDGIHDDGPKPDEQGQCNNFRIFTPDECIKLNAECRGLLWQLQQWNIIDTVTREVIIDRAMALQLNDIHIDHFKWIVLMVLINRGTDQSLEWLEEIVFGDTTGVIQ